MKKTKTFYEFFHNKRRELGITLREFCRKNKFDVGNVSKIERGKFSPPKKEKLEEYAKALGIKKGTDDWITFFDLASIDAGRIPEDIISDEKAVLALPMLFRTLRDKTVSDEDLDKIISIAKDS